MKLPKWIMPKEITTLEYWIHLVVLAIVALYLIDCFYNKKIIISFDTMFNVKNILLSVPALGAGDITAHTLLKLS